MKSFPIRLSLCQTLWVVSTGIHSINHHRTRKRSRWYMMITWTSYFFVFSLPIQSLLTWFPQSSPNSETFRLMIDASSHVNSFIPTLLLTDAQKDVWRRHWDLKTVPHCLLSLTCFPPLPPFSSSSASLRNAWSFRCRTSLPLSSLVRTVTTHTVAHSLSLSRCYCRCRCSLSSLTASVEDNDVKLQAPMSTRCLDTVWFLPQRLRLLLHIKETWTKLSLSILLFNLPILFNS